MTKSNQELIRQLFLCFFVDRKVDKTRHLFDKFLSTMMISTLLILERTLVKMYFMEEFPYKLFNWRNSFMMFVFVITASSGYMIIFSSKHNITNCSIIYSDFGWPLLIMLGILWCLVIVSSISIWVNICKNFKEFGNTGLQKYHGNVERIQTSIMMKPCKEREAIIKSTIRMISYTFHYIVPCKLNYLIGSNFFLH